MCIRILWRICFAKKVYLVIHVQPFYHAILCLCEGDTISRGSEEEETSVRRSLLGVDIKRPARHEISPRRRHHSSPGGRAVLDEPAYVRMAIEDSESEDSDYYPDKPRVDIEGTEFGGKNETDMQVKIRH